MTGNSMHTFEKLPSLKPVLAIALFLIAMCPGNAAVVIQNQMVEYRPTPLGIDIAHPRFSWQMATTAGERGYFQAAYRIEINDPSGNAIWNTGILLPLGCC